MVRPAWAPLAGFTSGRLLITLVIVAVACMAALPPTDPDLFWHLANGRLILSLPGWPHTDLYSFTAGGHQWVMHEWLSDLVMYGLYRLGGLSLLVITFALVVAASSVCLLLLFRSGGLRVPAALACLTMVGALAGSTTWGSRPQLFNLLFMGLLLLGLIAYRDGKLHPLLLVPFFWLWANLHSGFLVGVITAALFLLGEAFDSWRASRVIPPRVLQLAGALAGGVLASLLNPYGVDTLLFPLGTLTSPLIQNNIAEWASPDFHLLPNKLLEALLFVLLLGLATRKVKAPSYQWLWMLGLLYLAFSSQRHVPLFILAAAPLVGRSGQALLERGSSFFLEAASVARASAGFRLGLVNVCLLLLLGGGMFVYRALPNLLFTNQQQAIAASFPVGTMRAVAAYPDRMRLLNFYDFGGYLLFNLYPSGGRIFIDGRVEVYGSEIFKDYLTIDSGSSGWEQMVDRYNPCAAIFPTTHPATARLISSGWRVITKDRVSTLLTRPCGDKG